MCETLPHAEFEWFNRDKIKTFNIHFIVSDSEKGYIIQIDLKYVDINNWHEDLSICPTHNESLNP